MGIPKITLGIEVGDSSLKLALHDRSQKKILRTGVVPTASHPLREVELLERTIVEWLEPFPQVNANAITLSIPARLGIVRLVDIPADIKEIREYVEWEFETCINAQRSEFWMDFHVVPGRSKGSRVAVVGGVRKIWLETLRKGFVRRDLIPAVVELDAFSLMNLLEQGSGVKKGLVCAIKVDTTGVIIAWGQSGVLHALRWVSVSALSTMSRLEAFDALAKDMTKELHQGFAQLGVEQAAGQIVYLCGDLSIENDFVSALRKSSPDFLYHLLDSFPALKLDPQLAPEAMAPLCATAIGASFRYREDRK